MKRSHLIILTVLASSLSFYACTQSKSEPLNSASEEQVVYPAVKVETAKPSQELQIPGELESYFETDLFPKVNGYIKRINVDIGDKVASGQVLAVLDAPELSLQLAEATAKMRSAESQLNTSKSVFKRLQKANQTPGTVSPNDLDIAHSKIVSDSLTWLGTKAVYQSIQVMTEYLSIKAPFDGVVAERRLSPGAFVGPNDKSAVAIFKVKQENKLRLRIPVPERYINAIKLHQPIEFSVMNLPDKKFEGKVSRISHNVNKQTRSEIVEIDVPNPSLQLVSGTYTQVSLPLQRNVSSLVVPSSAVATTLEKCFVVKVENGLSSWVEVKKGIESEGKVEVFGDVKSGDIVLKTASDEIPNGIAIKTKL
ncbi:MAG: efflux RND transporter periplasmic adaptor subunit [Flectobacillus sp.]|uniref:efflux RND transporter periplasmic adaptor subunit n=1 Tax=Flectobacillus sp. TaxID=50419 RepID=UPI003B9B533C